jgi:hypothetical protein
MTHRCKAPGCIAFVSRIKPFCGFHWFALPVSHRAAIKQAFLAGDRLGRYAAIFEASLFFAKRGTSTDMRFEDQRTTSKRPVLRRLRKARQGDCSVTQSLDEKPVTARKQTIEATVNGEHQP